MNIKKILFPFPDHKESLKTKWWHRLFVVVFTFLIFLGVLSVIGGTVTGAEIGHYKLNSTILTTLNGFTADQDPSISDTVTLFVDKYENIGCLEDGGKISRLSTYTLESKAYCSADVSAHLSSIADRIIREQNPSVIYNATEYQSDKSGLIEVLEQRLTEDTEKRYCFIHQNIECSSHNIVAYKPNIFFYLGGLIISLIGLYLFSLFLQLIYFKGIIYVVYGKEECGVKEVINEES